MTLLEMLTFLRYLIKESRELLHRFKFRHYNRLKKLLNEELASEEHYVRWMQNLYNSTGLVSMIMLFLAMSAAIYFGILLLSLVVGHDHGNIIVEHGIDLRYGGEDAFVHFNGAVECDIAITSLYTIPLPLDQSTPFCRTREDLLEALSNGGRHGFDAPYAGRKCAYRWYPSPEICMIMARFNGILFVGDEIAQRVYMGLNILLQEDMTLGAMKSWAMKDDELQHCRCGQQFRSSAQIDAIDCGKFVIKSSNDINMIDRVVSCQHTTSSYWGIPANAVELTKTSRAEFQKLTLQKSRSWQPLPVIFSQSQELDLHQAIAMLDNVQQLIHDTGRRMPVLVLGPERLGYQGSIKAWEFDHSLRYAVAKQHWEYLGLWNMTLQSTKDANSQEAQKVAMVQAMMVVNWLSKLETH